jgi:hypothetical protein
MARLQSQSTLLYYPTPVSIAETLATWFTAPNRTRIADPCCGTGEALVHFSQGFNTERIGVELSYSRASQAEKVVEQIPLSAKQMVGAHRQFVHNKESVQRLPELALLVGSILSFIAATFPAMPTGFWDREPKRTPGRLRRQLAGKAFPKDAQISGQLREKKSVTGHLPKGNLARSQKTAQPAAT